MDKPALIRYQDFWLFYLFSFLFLALLPLLALVFNDGSMDFSVAAAAASEPSSVRNRTGSHLAP